MSRGQMSRGAMSRGTNESWDFGELADPTEGERQDNSIESCAVPLHALCGQTPVDSRLRELYESDVRSAPTSV